MVDMKTEPMSSHSGHKLVTKARSLRHMQVSGYHSLKCWLDNQDYVKVNNEHKIGVHIKREK